MNAASVLTQAKHLPSPLAPEKLRPNQVGDTASALLDGVASQPFPLVSGADAFGQAFVVPLYLRSASATMYFPEAVVSVTRQRNIVATPVLQGRGTVKELVTEGDLELSMTLALVSNTSDGDYIASASESFDVYPYKALERLRRLLDEQERLDVVSPFLQCFDLDGGELGVVVTSYTVEQQTHSSRQVVQVQALSDYDYNLIID